MRCVNIRKILIRNICHMYESISR